jgi:hypothetical protein
MKASLGTIAIWAEGDSGSLWVAKMSYSKQHLNNRTMRNPQAARLRIKTLVFLMSSQWKSLKPMT